MANSNSMIYKLPNSGLLSSLSKREGLNKFTWSVSDICHKSQKNLHLKDRYTWNGCAKFWELRASLFLLKTIILSHPNKSPILFHSDMLFIHYLLHKYLLFQQIFNVSLLYISHCSWCCWKYVLLQIIFLNTNIYWGNYISCILMYTSM